MISGKTAIPSAAEARFVTQTNVTELALYLLRYPTGINGNLDKDQKVIKSFCDDEAATPQVGKLTDPVSYPCREKPLADEIA